MLTLYSKETTSFSTLGIGVLRDFISHPLITEELNGAYTLEFEYAKDGYLSEYLIEQNIIKANGQAFRIWNIKKDMQKITVFAKHIFFDLSFNFLADVFPTNLTAQSALTWMLNRAAVATNFSATGNCTQTASTRYVRKNFIDAVFNEDNALLKKFGGELSYDNFNITVHDHRGTNANFSIRYKKNLTGIDFNLDFSNVATRIVPIGFDGLTIDSTYVESPRASNYFTPLYKTYEFNDIKYDPDDEEAYHTLAEAKQALINAANDLFTKNVDLPQVSIGVNFVELSKCSEYASYSNLETVHLGDTIDVIIPELNIHTSARVNKTVYDCTLERFITLEIGSAKQSIARTQINIENQIRKSENYLTQAQQNAENLINHPFNGNVYIDKENGVIYLMDSTSPETAQNVWKWSLGGLGFSSTGINGTYTVAILQDGRINADFITTGQLNTGVIQGYDSLLIQVDTLDREFQKEINPTDTATGSSITLEDSAETELIDFELEGKTTQETSNGYQLLKKATRLNGTVTNSVTTNGITFTNLGSGHFHISGTATARTDCYTFRQSSEQESIIVPIGKYTFSAPTLPNGVTLITSGGGGNNGFAYTELTSSLLSATSNVTDGTKPFNYFLIRVSSGTTVDTDIYFMLESGTVAHEWEPYEGIPSPDYPSELVSVGYENLFKPSATNNGVDINIIRTSLSFNQDTFIFTATGSDMYWGVADSSGATYSDSHGQLIPVNEGDIINLYISNPNFTKNYISRWGSDKKSKGFTQISSNIATYTVPSGISYITLRIGIGSSTAGTTYETKIMISKGTQQYSYIPYGKYGIEVKTTGKNLFDANNYNLLNAYYVDGTGKVVYGNNNRLTWLKLQPNTTYTLTQTKVSNVNRRVALFSSQPVANLQGTLLGTFSGANPINQTFTTNDTNVYLGWVYCNLTNLGSYTEQEMADSIQLEQGDTATTYEPYKSNTYLYTLDQPLRSIGDIKDLLYIKNGYLYVDRKIGSVDLSTITWNKYGHNVSGYSRYSATTISNIKYVSANTQLGNGIAEKYVLDVGRGISSKIDKIAIDVSQVSVVAIDSPTGEFIYELAEPYTETLGAIEVPSTYKGITYLNTTDELEPIMNISYVRDTLIANYVESHVSELKITEKGIESRVQTIEESDYGGRINAVEERTTDTEKNIEIISTNIDTTTGEVRKVTTTNGMTFDENGLNIHTNQNEFNTQITNEATEYKDGNSLINKTSRDGSLLTKLRLQEQTYYSCNGSDTSNPMNTENFDFVDERVEVDGEYCYATFYNGEE